MGFLLFLSEAMVPLMLFYIIGFGLLAGRPVLDDFIEGAKEGMRTVSGILPTLVGLMVAVGVLRASGFLDFLGELLKMPAALLHVPSELVPVVLVRLVSNSAATGLVLDIFKEYGADSSLGLMASILMSSTETVLYCMSIYFGAAGIRKTRYTLAGGLLAAAGDEVLDEELIDTLIAISVVSKRIATKLRKIQEEGDKKNEPHE